MSALNGDFRSYPEISNTVEVRDHPKCQIQVNAHGRWSLMITLGHIGTNVCPIRIW